MDPLSIVAGLASLATFCVRVASSLNTFYRNIRSAGSNLYGLYQELHGFSLTLKAIEKTWNQNPIVVMAHSVSDADLWASVKNNLDSSTITVKKLDKTLKSVEKYGLFWEVKLNSSMTDIMFYRQRINSHHVAMQSGLQMISLCLHLQGNASQQNMERSLARLRDQIRRIDQRIELVLRSAQNSRSTQGQIEREGLVMSLESLAGTARSFYSSASSVVSGSRSTVYNDSVLEINDPNDGTVWGGSIIGRPLTEGQYNGIKNWIPPANIMEGDYSNTALDHSTPRRPKCSNTANNRTFISNSTISQGTIDIVAAYSGPTQLYSEAVNGRLTAVKQLLEEGADFQVTSENGWTPLNAAATNGHFDVVDVLLKKGADFTVTNVNGWTPLNGAAGNGHLEVVEVLLEKGADFTIANNTGQTPLYSAARGGHTDVMKLLLEKGADFRVANVNGWTPLNGAAGNGHLEVVEVLLEKGADFTIPNNTGQTPLYSAAREGHTEVVKLLLEKGADFRVTNKNGWTPLNGAADNGHLEVVEVLLAKGADFTIANNTGQTPLDSAALSDHDEVVKVLLENGADFTVTSERDLVCLNNLRKSKSPPTSSRTEQYSVVNHPSRTSTWRHSTTRTRFRVRSTPHRVTSVRTTPKFEHPKVAAIPCRVFDYIG